MSVNYGDKESTVYIGTMLFICAVAVVLNVLVIAVIGKAGKFRTSVEIFLTNLAVSDIVQAAIVLPIHFKNVSVYDKDFYGDDHVCKLIMFIPLFTVTSAICTIISIAVDRYRVMIHRLSLSRLGTLIIVCIIWLTSSCVSAPQLYEYNIYYQKSGNSTTVLKACGSEGIVENFETVYASIVFVLVLCIPLVVLFFCYVKISILIWRHGRRFRFTASQQPNSESSAKSGSHRLEKIIWDRKIKVLKVLVSVTVTFIVLWTPYFILFLIQETSDMDHVSDAWQWSHVISRTMTVLGTLANPTLYLIFSDPFRKAVVNLCPCGSFRRIGESADPEETEVLDSSSISCLCCSKRLNSVAPVDVANNITMETKV